jgi:hypothetical protein
MRSPLANSCTAANRTLFDHLARPTSTHMMKVKLPRRTFFNLAAGAAALPVASSIAWAQAYPTRPVRVILVSRRGAAAILLRA